MNTSEVKLAYFMCSLLVQQKKEQQGGKKRLYKIHKLFLLVNRLRQKSI